jgi:hypothetical protein
MTTKRIVIFKFFVTVGSFDCDHTQLTYTFPKPDCIGIGLEFGILFVTTFVLVGVRDAMLDLGAMHNVLLCEGLLGGGDTRGQNSISDPSLDAVKSSLPLLFETLRSSLG